MLKKNSSYTVVAGCGGSIVYCICRDRNNVVRCKTSRPGNCCRDADGEHGEGAERTQAAVQAGGGPQGGRKPAGDSIQYNPPQAHIVNLGILLNVVIANG
eukprot:scaffold16968_cov34-Prasinocladus_malaysianus.AAC.1